MTCCGKVICSGCSYAPVYDNQGNEVAEKKCAFCRVPISSSDEESNKRERKRVELNDPIVMYNTGNQYRDGRNGYSQDYKKALELYHRSAELGHARAYNSIGYAYDKGEGMEVDKEKAEHYFELAAMAGDVTARYNLGNNELGKSNADRALKHFMIAVRDGFDESLNKIKRLYTYGHATKEDYTQALQAYQAYLRGIKSPQRDEAAAADEGYRYY